MRLTADVCAVFVVDDGMVRRWVYVPWRETMEPNLAAAINEACDRAPQPTTWRRKTDG